MSNPNFVHDLVQMAKAFEELPQVQSDLAHAREDISNQAATIQRLEMRIMDLKSELDAAHEATRKAEVERDHAERMFLETDDRLNAFQRLVQSFQTEVGAFTKAAEPIEQVTLPPAATTEPEAVPMPPPNAPVADAGVAEGQREAPPTLDQGPTDGPVSSGEASQPDALSGNSEGVSVQRDPTPASENTSESGWPGSTQSEASHSVNMTEQSATATGHTANQDAANTQTSQPGEAPSQPDPTASSPVGATPLPSSAPTDAAASVADAPADSAPAEDDVGYHNEPKIDGHNWDAWDAWCHRMNNRYGISNWPARPLAAQ